MSALESKFNVTIVGGDDQGGVGNVDGYDSQTFSDVVDLLLNLQEYDEMTVECLPE